VSARLLRMNSTSSVRGSTSAATALPLTLSDNETDTGFLLVERRRGMSIGRDAVRRRDYESSTILRAAGNGNATRGDGRQSSFPMRSSRNTHSTGARKRGRQPRWSRPNPRLARGKGGAMAAAQDRRPLEDGSLVTTPPPEFACA